MIRTLRTAAIATALLLAAGNAWALGLGQIEVKSRRNQPLVAEIPIISTTPGELEALKARLASPETFRRVGLAPPSGVAADLQFSLGSDARGRPVIRVTTTRPVEASVLNFLVEVDWGQGRLVREYSALVDAPNTASAPLQPPIDAPVAPAANVIQRPVAPPVAAAQVPVAAPVEEDRPEPPPTAIAIAPLPPAQPAAPVAALPAPAPAPAPAQYGPIKQGETLSKIAGKLDLPSGYSLDQAMLALLRANPDAFLGDDINRLRRGSVLRVPGSAELGSVGADEASQVVRQQMQQWRQARRPVRQPEIAAAPAASAVDAPRPATPTATVPPKPAAPKPAGPKPAAATAVAPARPAVPARRQEARLQIIPPAAPGKATGTRSGTAAGGEGSMLQQQLRQRDEDIAAKAAEIGDLKERVAELEKLKEQQQQLLSLKDSELATAQQRLAEANKAAAAARPAVAQAATPSAPQASEQVPARQDAAANAPSPMPYIWGGLGLAAIALLAWLLFGRRKPAPAPRRSSFDSDALAASLVHPAAAAEPADVADPDPEPASDHLKPEPTAIPAPVEDAPRDPPTINLADVPATATRVETPAWHSGWMKAESAIPPLPPAESAAPRFVPAEDDLPEEAVVPAPQASPEQRMKLAHAFLDIGDDHSAKQLLQELQGHADPAVRSDAARLLRDIR